MDSPATSSRKNALWRHGLVILAMCLNASAIVLAVWVDQNPLLLPRTPEIISLQKVLPALGAILGGLFSIINAMAFATLFTAHSKRLIAWEGVTFSRLGELHSLAIGAIPTSSMRFFFLGAIILICQAVLPSGIVASVTPTNAPWTTTGLRMPLADFSAASGVSNIPIKCEYATALGDGQIFGYGVNCPIDTSFGEIYSAGVSSLRGTFPVNSTRAGVSYPSTMLGISGSISNITHSWVTRITADKQRAVAPTDVFNVCVPRMKVAVTCNPRLGNGESFRATNTPFNGPSPRSIISVSLCGDSGCIGPRTVSNFDARASSIFSRFEQDTGNTVVSIYNFGTYIEAMGAESIQCTISSQEEHLPVRIVGGLSVEANPSISCPKNRAQPNPQFLINVNRISEMSLIKMQGADGKFEPIALVPSGDRVQALEKSIQRMVSVAATEMYATLQSNKTLTSQWSATVPFTYITNRTRLGDTGSHRTLIFSVAPLVLIILLFIGWVYVGFRKEGNLVFDPLSPVCAAAAGMNRNELSATIAGHSTSGPKELAGLDDLLVKYVYVADGRMGLDTSALGGLDMKVLPPHPGMNPHKSSGYESFVSQPMPSPMGYQQPYTSYPQ